VCPTGIDIRNGLQFECIGCAQCIDACDAVMSKIGRPLGLIRYGSQAGMAGEPTRILRPRVIIYPAILAGVLGLLCTLLATRSPTDVTLLRSPGAPFIVTPAGQVQNVMRLKLTNRTERAQDLTVSIVGRDDVTIITEQQPIHLDAGATTLEALQLLAPPAAFQLGWLDVTVRVGSVGPDANLKIERPCRLLGPNASANLTQGGGHVR
jgi:polyferredoxin